MWNFKPETGQVVHSWSGCKFITGPWQSDIIPHPFHFNGISQRGNGHGLTANTYFPVPETPIIIYIIFLGLCFARAPDEAR